MQCYSQGLTPFPTCMSCHPCAGPHHPRLSAQRGRSSLAAPTPAIVSSSGPGVVWGQLPHLRHPHHLQWGWLSLSWTGLEPPAGLPGSQGVEQRQSWELRWERFGQRRLWSPENLTGKLSPDQDLQTKEGGGSQLLHLQLCSISVSHRSTYFWLQHKQKGSFPSQGIPSLHCWKSKRGWMHGVPRDSQWNHAKAVHIITKARNNLQANKDLPRPRVSPPQSPLWMLLKPSECPTCCHEPSRLHWYHGDVLSHRGLAVWCQLLWLGVWVHGDTSGQGHRGGDCQQGRVVGGSQAAALLCGQ